MWLGFIRIRTTIAIAGGTPTHNLPFDFFADTVADDDGDGVHGEGEGDEDEARGGGVVLKSRIGIARPRKHLDG